MKYKLGSLFDGSGGFPLAGALCGIEPVWAAEVEPYPIAVTRSRFPNMKHLGDITKVNGADIEPVDIITFGSPCQDLSVAGKRAGLKHEDNGDEETTRSGLFMEAIRIIKEMRKATNGKYPRFALWENVPGAFSSNKGEDFRIVLEEIIKTTEPSAVMPAVPEAGWAYSDSYSGEEWSLAYRVFDAQYWGVPQRRRRIHLIADFGGQCAEKILFERQGLYGHFTQSRKAWQTAPTDAERGTGADDREGDEYITLEPGIAAREGGHVYEGVSGTLRAHAGDNQMAVAYPVENHPADSRVSLDESGKVQTLTSRMGTGGGNVPMVMEPFCKSRRAKSPDDATTWKHAKVANTLNTFDTGEVRANELIVEGCPVFCLQGNGIDRADTAGCNGKGWRENECYTLNTIDRPAVVYEEPIAIDRAFFNQGQNALYDPQTYEDGTNPTIVAKGPSAVCYGIGNGQANQSATEERIGALNCMHDQQAVAVPQEANYIVRRLTPTECARLQGFPDKWGHPEPKERLTDTEYLFWHEVRVTYDAINGREVKTYTKKQILTWYNKLHTDAAEYKMWGNGIALPPALYCMEGIVNALNEDDDSWML